MDGSDQNAPLTHILKDYTKDIHMSLEQTIGLTDERLTVQQYKDILLRMSLFIYSCELQLSFIKNWNKTNLNLTPRLKSNLIAQDFLFYDLEDAAQEFLRRIYKMGIYPPSLDSLASGLGYLYVMEGSTLGGKIISAHLKKHLGITPETGGAYFNSYGTKVGAMWHEFCAALNQYAEQYPNQQSEIIESAYQTFLTLKNWLLVGRVGE